MEVFRQQRGRNEIKVVVRRPESERISEFDLEEFIVRTPGNVEVPLRDVVNITSGRAYTVINHVNGQRSLVVTADVTPDNETSQVLSDVLRDTMPQLQAKYPGLSYSIEGKQGDMAEGTSILFSGLILAMLVIFALLAIPFKSYSQPAIVMCSIPIGRGRSKHRERAPGLQHQPAKFAGHRGPGRSGCERLAGLYRLHQPTARQRHQCL